MPTPPLPLATAKAVVHAVERALRQGFPPPGVPIRAGQRGALAEAARQMDMPRGSVASRLAIAERRYRPVDWTLWRKPAGPAAGPTGAAAVAAAVLPLEDRLLAALRKAGGAPAALARRLEAKPAEVEQALRALKARGFNLTVADEVWKLGESVPPAYLHGPLRSLMLDADHTLRLGVTGDNHLGSKYERLDVLNWLYDAFAEAGVRTVLNTGNWIDGEARFNRHDLHTAGMDGQLRYLAAHYPRRKDIETWAVTGDDHEGWYAQREGVDVGRYAAALMHANGRDDWVDLGYMDAPVRLVNRASGRDAILSVVHPGGGSAYALSYSIQKIIESLDGGEKPAVAFYGHFHKLWAGNIRNVWCVQSGCTQDQTPFMRTRRLEAHVGGALVRLTQDPATGAIVRCQVELLRFFVRGYYASRWSRSGAVTRPKRAA